VATAVSGINRADRKKLYDQLLLVAKRKTATADVKLDERGRKVTEDPEDFGDNVLIVEPTSDFGLRTAEGKNGQKAS
jgi:hypothetical protein